MATGTITHTPVYNQGRIAVHQIAWVSDASGNVNGTISGLSDVQLQVAFDPDSGGTQPTTLYDMTLTNPAGVDVLGGEGANLSNSTSTQETPRTTDGFPFVLGPGNYTLDISGAGNAKGGKLWLYTT